VNAVGPLRLGFAPLNDAAALIVARDKGFFGDEGLSVDLSREASWATVRDKLSAGLLDGAHMLAPLALAMTLGAGCDVTPVIAPFAMNLGGAAVTLSTRLAAHVAGDVDARGLAALIGRRRDQGSSPLTFATVFPYSIHNYLLRDWLAQAGVDPDRDVRLTVVPPARTADLLADGVIEGFCAGEPWNQVAERAGVGRTVMRAARFAPSAPDKVFAVTEDWARADPARLQALLRALLRASAWADDADNRVELAAMLEPPMNIGVERAAIAAGMSDIRFHRDGANRPRSSHAIWLMEQMRRWGQLTSDRDADSFAARVYRPDLFDEAVTAPDA
jgi:NitT/TauT family transport system ATP-binding protein/nitrate/nitrite transport system substrate-binding protein